MRFLMLILLLCLPHRAEADEKLVRLFAPAELVATGLLRHVAPRFSLKTQIRVELVETISTAHISLGSEGRALFQDGRTKTVWHMKNTAPQDPATARLAAWLVGEIGQRTILNFAPDGVPLFVAPEPLKRAVSVLSVEGDPVRGHDVSVLKCGRCHAANAAGRMNDIGSTPSFFVLRALPDWQDRFSAFYSLNPHPSFTQVRDVTEPFAIDRPPPIVPIEVTLDEIRAILAYVATLKAADLGSPLIHQ